MIKFILFYFLLLIKFLILSIIEIEELSEVIKLYLISNTAMGLIIGCSILLVAIIVLALVLILKNKTKGIKIDEEFMNQLISSLGAKENIISYSVENSRVKFELLDVSKANLDSLKELSSKGVFVTNNTVKTLFKYESNQIVANLNRIIK